MNLSIEMNYLKTTVRDCPDRLSNTEKSWQIHGNLEQVSQRSILTWKRKMMNPKRSLKLSEITLNAQTIFSLLSSFFLLILFYKQVDSIMLSVVCTLVDNEYASSQWSKCCGLTRRSRISPQQIFATVMTHRQ